MDVTNVASLMARRKSSKRRRSPRRNYLSLTGTAETLILANAGTNALFGMGVVPFLTEGWLVPQSNASINSWQLSASELVKGIIPGGASYGQSGKSPWTNDAAGVAAAMKRNLQNHGAASVATAIVTPIAFKMGKKLFRRPISMGNKLLKGTGVKI